MFDSANYNFASTAMRSFIKLCQEKDLHLLLPAPTRGEIQRHMLDRAQAADEALNKALNDVHKKASFLAAWDRFPVAPKNKNQKYALKKHCDDAWNAFCKQIKVQEIKYEGVQLGTIMMWYDLGLAPFGKGKKQKEFPDAIAMAILNHYGSKNDQRIAVVSDDSDIKAGCDRFQNLLYFPSLSSFLEAWLSENDDLDLYINLINAGLDDLNEVIHAEIGDWGVFTHYNKRYSCGSTSITGVNVGGFDVIGMGDHECTIAFLAAFEAEHLLAWEDDWPDGSPRMEDGWVSQGYEFGGTAKIKFSQDKKSMESCDNIEVDTHDFEIYSSPRNSY